MVFLLFFFVLFGAGLPVAAAAQVIWYKLVRRSPLTVKQILYWI